MNIKQLLMLINNKKECEFGIEETRNNIFGKEHKGFLFYVKNDNIDNYIESPYKVATELINNKCVYQVTLVDYLECRAFTYTKNYQFNIGENIIFEEFSFDWFARHCEDISSRRNVNIYFSTLNIRLEDMQNIGKLRLFKEIMPYLKNVNYEEIRDPSMNYIEPEQVDIDSDLPF